MRSLPHQAKLRDELHGAGEHAKRMIDHIITAACLLLEDHQANEGAETSAQSEKPLTLEELAARLGRNKRTIQEWVSNHGLPDLRAHSNADPIFDWREVIEWMKRHRDHKINCLDGRRDNRIISQAPSNGTPPQATQRRS